MSSAAFSMVELIRAKRRGDAHDASTLQDFVAALAAGVLPDYQVSAWLMAVMFQGLNLDEVTELTRLIAHSGTVLDLSALPGPAVDKHSTGGVGDKVTLIVVPMLAACGLTVAKLSGRGLGHTGGTADKLEAIPGFRVSLQEDELLEQLSRVGAAVATQSQNLAPVDGLLYALRDVTATVDSTPLIAVSVMSKKIASGADVILLDVKAGAGAFMPTVAAAQELAELMCEVGRRLGKRVIGVVTDMGQPLGFAVGHANEVAEAIATLQGRGPEDLTALCVALVALMLEAAERVSSYEAGRVLALQVLHDGRAVGKLAEVIVAQGGDAGVLAEPLRMPQPRERVAVRAVRDGRVMALDALGVGMAAKALGAGRQRKGDPIDLAVGVSLRKKLGDAVLAGDVLAELLVNDPSGLESAVEALLTAYVIGDGTVDDSALIKAVIRP